MPKILVRKCPIHEKTNMTTKAEFIEALDGTEARIKDAFLEGFELGFHKAEYGQVFGNDVNPYQEYEDWKDWKKEQVKK